MSIGIRLIKYALDVLRMAFVYLAELPATKRVAFANIMLGTTT